jgi:hypothetical protein
MVAKFRRDRCSSRHCGRTRYLAWILRGICNLLIYLSVLDSKRNLRCGTHASGVLSPIPAARMNIEVIALCVADYFDRINKMNRIYKTVLVTAFKKSC